MQKRLYSLFLAGLLAACSPQFNWREVSGPGYQAMFPDKPASFTRAIDLQGLKVNMTMQAAQIDHTVFAVGSAELADPTQVMAALSAMQVAMVKNIGGTITASKADGASFLIDAKGPQQQMHGRFVGRGKRVYQVIVMGPPQEAQAEQTETFMSSFKLQ